jgi:hypothetical protein
MFYYMETSALLIGQIYLFKEPFYNKLAIVYQQQVQSKLLYLHILFNM